MQPYFSQNFHSEKQHEPSTYKKQVFIDFRDFIDTSLSPTLDIDAPIEFEVYWHGNNRTFGYSNSLDCNGNPIIDKSSGQSLTQSLNIPPYDYVKQVELLGISFPKIENEMYFIVDIPEFDGVLHASHANAHEKFAIVYYDDSTIEKGTIQALRGTDFVRKICTFNPPLNNFSKFKIRFLTRDGPITYRYLDTSGNPMNANENIKAKLRQCSLLLEFTIKI